MKKYRYLTIGGTFDHLHAGHTALINHALKISDYIKIALTSDIYTQRKNFSHQIQTYAERKKSLLEYVSKNKTSSRVSILPINDLYGFSLHDASLQAIVVTRETYKNALIINKERIKKRLPPLDIVQVPLLKGPDKHIIRAERIRKGLIDRSGNPYAYLFVHKNKLLLPKELRGSMRIPLGIIMKNEHETLQHITKTNPAVVITVGDIVTASLKKKGFIPDITITDGKSRRANLSDEKSKKMRTYYNAPGTIQNTAVVGFKQKLTTFLNKFQKTALVIKGEEDLLALPAILLAPLGAFVLYGQFNQGIVITEVTEDTKKLVKKLLLQFA